MAGDIADLDSRIKTNASDISSLKTATTTTLPKKITDTVDALGNSLAANSGSNVKTITGISYDETNHEATVTYANIAFPTVDTQLKDGSSNAIANNAVYDETQAIRSLVSGVSTRIDNLDFTDPTAAGEATTVITSVSQTDGKINATKATLPSFDAPTASGDALAFINNVS